MDSPYCISYCVPCHKRIDELVGVFPSIVAAANASPPIEIVIVDYGDQPPLTPQLLPFAEQLINGSKLVVKEYRGRPHYHMSHARNLSIRAASGKYIMIGATDVVFTPKFFAKIRRRFEETNADYIRAYNRGRWPGIIIILREELIAAGGFDERFEFYGPEDKDLRARLNRRNLKDVGFWIEQYMSIIPTPWEEKKKNYRELREGRANGRRAMEAVGRAIFEENNLKGVLVANEGIEWGAG